jgi:hypothetical protein
LIYSIINFFIFLFFFTFLKETKGLTDRQKKQLYLPEEFKEAEIELSSSIINEVENTAPQSKDDEEEEYDELEQTTIVTDSIDIDYEDIGN